MHNATNNGKDMLEILKEIAKRSSHVPQEDIIEELYELMNYFENKPDPKCIPLFLSCLTPDSDPEIVQTFAHVLREHNKDDVVENLKQILLNDNSDIRCWAAHLAVEFPSHKLIAPLTDMILYSQDFDTVIFSSSALLMVPEMINAESVLKKRMGKEESEVLKQELRYVIEENL